MIQTAIVNIEYLFILLIVMTALLHTLFVFLFPQNKRFWKKMDYIWLGLATLSIVTASQKVRIVVYDNYQNRAESLTISSFSSLNNNVQFSLPCKNFIKSEFSPENFDEIVAEYKRICTWNKGFESEIAALNPKEFPDVMFKTPKAPIESVELNQYLEQLKKQIQEYEQYRTQMWEYKKQTEETALEQLLFFLLPVFLCAAIALRITKVTAELKLNS